MNKDSTSRFDHFKFPVDRNEILPDRAPPPFSEDVFVFKLHNTLILFSSSAFYMPRSGPVVQQPDGQ